jgi:Uma2 family endonuclease
MERTAERAGMPLDEFLEAAAHQPFELINGERRPKLPTVFIHAYVLDLLLTALKRYLEAHALGVAYGETTFILPGAYDANWVSGSRTPDILYIARPRFEAFLRTTADLDSVPLMVIPDLVVEVVSPSDRYTEMNEKARLYLSDGVRLAWLVDPAGRNVAIHAAGADSPLVLRGDDAILDGGAVLPGFQIALGALFNLDALKGEG